MAACLVAPAGCALLLDLEDRQLAPAVDGDVRDGASDAGPAADGDVLGDAASGVDGSEVLAQGNAPRGVAVDGTSVFWANEGSGTIVRRAKTDNAAIVVVAANIQGARSVLVDTAYVYWGANNTPARKEDGGAVLTTVVGRTAKDKAPDAGTTGITSYQDSVVEQGHHVAFFEGYDRADGGAPAPADNYVFFSSDPAVFSSRRDFPALTQQNYTGESSRVPGLVKADETSFYWITRDNQTLWRQVKTNTCSGCAIPTSVDSVGAVADFLVDDANIFLLTDTGTLLRRRKAGVAGTPKEAVAQAGLFPQQMTADDRYIYWTRGAQEEASTDGQVLATPKDGTAATPIVLAAGLRRPFGIAVDHKLTPPPRYVYYTTVGDGAIRRVRTP